MWRRSWVPSSRALTTSAPVLAVALSVLAATTAASGQNRPPAPPPPPAPGSVLIGVVGGRGQAPDLVGVDPQSQPGPVERRARPITPENPIPRRLSSVDPLYPSEAAGLGAFGTVAVRVTLDETGTTAEVRSFGASIRVPGDASASAPTSTVTRAFIRSSIDAVRQWVYDAPAQGPISFQVTFSFNPGATAGTMVGQDTTARLAFAQPTAGAAAPAPAGAPGSGGPVRVGGNIGPPKKITDVKPVYPPIAQSAKVSGIVIIEATIGADGRVTDARVLRSIPLLDQAALEAVRQWEFVPTLLNGVPTAIIMSVTVNFALEQ
jgi:TonB family protein